MNWRFAVTIAAIWAVMTLQAAAQTSSLVGTVRDEAGGVLPGVFVGLRVVGSQPQETVSDARGESRFDTVPAGRAEVAFALINFATTRRGVMVPPTGSVRVDAVLHVAMYADVTVTGKGTFTNLADAPDPAQNLVGIAQSASQGAITARQLESRPISRAGEVLETVPGVIISQHSGEGKANQYYLRGFNLDHGTDFATTVAGIPVNMPTHAHGQGYSDLNFLIPELVSGVQFSKGPYFADQGDFASAGAANINYANVLDSSIARLDVGDRGYRRAVCASSPAVGSGHALVAFEIDHNDGPWVRPDDHRKLNGVLRYSQGNSVRGISLTAMGYQARWNSTDQIPERAIASGLIGRFGAIDPTDGGRSSRYSLSADWQRGRPASQTRITAYGLFYDLHLFSNFTFFLDDPANGDQFEQADRRFVSGARVSHQRFGRWRDHSIKNTVGVQLRNDDISNVGLYHTQARVRLDARSQNTVLETSGGVYAQNETEWALWLRSTVGVRADAFRFKVDALDSANSGTQSAAVVSPKGGVTFGPLKGTEFYANAGTGYHSNDARGTTITRDALGNPADRVTPLVRTKGAELGMRTVAVPHLQSTFALWTLRLASELVFVGDAATTEAGRPSDRDGVEWANYYTPRPWLTFDGDLAWSRARFTDVDPAGDLIPGSAQTVVSFGATVDGLRGTFGSVRWRYFGSRPLIEDGSVRSDATSLVNIDGGYKINRTVRVGVEVFNLMNAPHSDIDYYYPSRLPGEPRDGVDDLHFHPTLPRTSRVNLTVTF